MQPASTEGLLYGLVQSGKTNVMTACAALAVDNGYRIIVILTSDINPLYDQTLERIQSSLRGMNVIGKGAWKDTAELERLARSSPVAIVCSKNWKKLPELLGALQTIRAGDLPAFIIDDEADQASLNTQNSKSETEKISRINATIRGVRQLFKVKTFLQVTATPQALYLQVPGNDFRPTFTVLSEPGESYVGGDQFFGSGRDNLLRFVDIEEGEYLKQGSTYEGVPPGLAKSLYTFFIGAASKAMVNAVQGYSFLCHVSLKTRDHEKIVGLIGDFRAGMMADFASGHFEATETYKGLKEAYEDLISTDSGLPPFTDVLPKVLFFLRGASIKLVNSKSGQEITTEKAFNLFVGGNKLGRGVTIKNLLVSYYGRNPRRPNADTVLQHARMYGYREDTKGVTRLFLPESLAFNFESIHLMEKALRNFPKDNPEGDFQGILVTRPVRPTRSNVLPKQIGYYVGGANYNPYWPLRSSVISPSTIKLDSYLQPYKEGEAHEIEFDFLKQLINLVELDEAKPSFLWRMSYLEPVLHELETHARGRKPCLVVIRRRSGGITAPRGETRGILQGGEKDMALSDRLTLFMVRQHRISDDESEVWWPQLRFADGRYLLAFSYK